MPDRRATVRYSAAVLGASLGAAALALPAQASTETMATRPARHKVEFPTAEAWAARARSGHRATHAASGAGLLTFGGGVDGIGVTTGVPKVYVVFWGSQWGTSSSDANGNVILSGDSQGIAPRVQAMLKGLGTNGESWSGVMTQYCEGVAAGSSSCPPGAAHVGHPTGGTVAGVWVDTSAAAPSQATDHQIGQEAVNAAAHFANTTAPANRDAQYVVVSPSGTHPGGFNTANGNFCAWHDWNGDTSMNGGAVSSPYGDIAFTNLPYLTDLGASCGAGYVNGSSGNLDGVTIVEGHEYAETITDQNPAGGWIDSIGYENGDKCAWVGVGGSGGAQNVSFATGSFPMQATFSNDANACQISHPIVSPGNDFSLSVSPSNVAAPQGSSNVSTSVATTLVSGAVPSVQLSLSGAPVGVSGAFSPNPVPTGNSSTLTFTVAPNASPGTYALTISGTGASVTHATTVHLTVAVPNDFSLSLSPTSVSSSPSSAVSTTVNTSLVAGSVPSVQLSLSGTPAGVTGSFSPGSVPAGSSSALKLTITASAARGTYTLTVSGTGASVTHTANLSLTISGVVNGGFETGSLTGWTASGTASVASPGHTGNYAAVLGATTPTSGDSSITQTFVATSGSLSLWYAVHCPDTVQYDWATVTLRDNTTGRTKTLLSRTCTNTGSWKQLAATVVVGHSYRLTLTSHDDHYPGDPTYTQYDDVTN